jgi:hypothetical protein
MVRTYGGRLDVEDGLAEDDPGIVVHDGYAQDPAHAFSLAPVKTVALEALLRGSGTWSVAH